MSDVKFELKPVEEKPRRKYRTGSKYDLILNAFIYAKGNHRNKVTCVDQHNWLYNDKLFRKKFLEISKNRKCTMFRTDNSGPASCLVVWFFLPLPPC
jgi:hypothetical protein